MKEILTTQPLLDFQGNLMTSGFARHMNFIYDKKAIKSRPLRLKEWDFYQIHFDNRFVLQLTLGHVSYAMQVGATLIDLATGERHQVGKLAACRRSFKKKMPVNPEVAHTLQYFSKNLHAQFEVTDKYRRLSLTANDSVGVKAEINLMLTNVSKSKEKMVIATPFDKSSEWYLNYKENCFVVNGYCRIEDVCYGITNGFGLLDWGRGIWPYKHSWVWGNGGTVVDGKHFGFNIGWGFGNTEAATENMFFYNNKAYKLAHVQEVRFGDKIRFIDDEGKFEFDVEPIFENKTKTRFLWVNNKCNQVFGKWTGRVTLDDGNVLEIPTFIAFCERADNKW